MSFEFTEDEKRGFELFQTWDTKAPREKAAAVGALLRERDDHGARADALATELRDALKDRDEAREDAKTAWLAAECEADYANECVRDRNEWKTKAECFELQAADLIDTVQETGKILGEPCVALATKAEAMKARAEKAEAECERLREAAQTAIDAWLKVDHDTELYHACILLAKIVNGDEAALRGELE